MNKFTRWLPAISLMLVIFLLSSIPSEEMPRIGTWDTLLKKTGHMLGFGLLASGFWFALQWKEKHLMAAFLLTILYALADEFHQSFVPGRNPSLVDALGFDTAGAAILLLVIFLGKRWYKRKAGNKPQNQ